MVACYRPYQKENIKLFTSYYWKGVAISAGNLFKFCCRASSKLEQSSPINWRLAISIPLLQSSKKTGRRVNLINMNIKTGKSNWFGLLLRFENQRESKSGSLMLKSYFYSLLCQNYLYLGFSSRSDILRAIKSCRTSKRYKSSDKPAII